MLSIEEKDELIKVILNGESLREGVLNGCTEDHLLACRELQRMGYLDKCNPANNYNVIWLVFNNGLVDFYNKGGFTGLEKRKKESEEKKNREAQKFELEITKNKREVRWFYPILIGSFFSGCFSIISILAQMQIIPLPKFGTTTEQQKEHKVLASPDTTKINSAQTAGTSTKK